MILFGLTASEGQEPGCSLAGLCGSESPRLRSRRWPGLWSAQGSCGAGLHPGEVSGSGFSSSLVVGWSPQLLANVGLFTQASN